MIFLRFWPVTLVAMVLAGYVWMMFHQNLVYLPLVTAPAGLTLLALQVRDMKMGRICMRSGWIYRTQEPGFFWWGHLVHVMAAVGVIAMPSLA